jgi:hypothetical protein
MYQVLEVSLSNLQRLYQYKLNDGYQAAFSLKGFDYPWLLGSHKWVQGEKVLDVGSAYSSLPMYIQKTYVGEVWAADDFGLSSNEPFWTRNCSPQQQIADHPEVKFVLERLGDPASSSLPQNYFDVIYSISTLEHIPCSAMPAVWGHLDSLLKPGGEMLHAIEIFFPSDGGIKRISRAILFDILWHLLPFRLQVRGCQLSPCGCARLAFKILGIHYPLGKQLSVLNMVNNPDILTEDYAAGLNRIVKDKITDFRYQRIGSLMLRLRKVG